VRWSTRARAPLLVAAALVILASGLLLWWLLGSESRALTTIARGLTLGLIVGAATVAVSFARPPATRLVEGTPLRPNTRRYLVPGEVPPPPVYFVGQKALLDELSALVRSARGHRRRPFVLVIQGEAGVGKSAFARKLAAEAHGHFRDGILYASMTGATEHSERVRNVLGDLVDSLQGPGDTVPESRERRRAALVKLSRRKRRPVLYVFDDVADAATAEAVMPAGWRAVVLITSRVELNLGPVERRELRPLGPEDGGKLLRLLLGNPGPEEADAASLDRVVASAAGYPLALNLAARAIASQGLWALPEITAQLPSHGESDLAKARERMLEFSFNVLSEIQKRVLLRLAWLPEPVFVPWMATALADLPNEDDVWLVCERLADERFLERITPDATGVVKFRMLDRVEAYVRARAARELDPLEAAEAGTRLEAARLARRARSLDTVPDAINQGHVARALDEARGVLADAVGVSGIVGTGRSEQPVVRQAYAMIAEILAELGGLDDALEIATVQLDEGDRGSLGPVADDAAEAQLRRTLGRLLRRAWKLDESVKELERALAAAARLGQIDEQVSTLRELAIVESMRTEKPDNHIAIALAHLQRADRLLGDAGNAVYLRCRLDEARSIVRLNDVANHGGSESQLQEAITELDRAADSLPNGYRLWQAWFAYHKARVLIRQARNRDTAGDAVFADPDDARRIRREARRLAQTALDAFASMSHRYASARCRLELGRTFAVEQRPEVAARALPLLEEARETFIFCGDRWIEAQTALVLAQVRMRLKVNRDEAVREVAFAQTVFAAMRDRNHLNEANATRAALQLEVLS
jgi:tetratricopeptide (TPR) repeat protein